MVVGPVNEVDLFLRVVDIARKLLDAQFCVDDRRDILLDFTTDGAIWKLYL